ncbi:MAG: PARP-type zinc finger-containing protein [Candidatus Thorarchaeota archaeon]
MKMTLESDDEWGFYIDPKTFEISKIVDEIPDGSFVIIKEREYIEDIDRTVTQTSYGLVQGNKFSTFDKRGLSSLMSEACATYMLKNNQFPPKVRIHKELKPGKPANLAFELSKFDIFYLKITDKQLKNKDPVEIINQLKEDQSAKLTSYDHEDSWKIEYAKSSRATCKTCGIKIEKDTVRAGEPYYYEDHLNYRWHHEKCIFWKALNKDTLKGLDDLEKEDKKRILSHFD